MKIISVFWCLLYAMWTKGTIIKVNGFEGGEVSFKCSHRLAWKNNKYLCKDPCAGSVDTLLTVTSGKRAESGRITLEDSGDGAFTVNFRLLQLSDSGRYWCAVERPGFDTFTEVHLTVEEATANEPTVKPELSSTWTYQHMSNSTQLTSGMNVSRLPKLSPASNCTVGEPNISTGTIWYAATGAVFMLTTLVLGMCFRRHRKNSNPKPQACSSSTGRPGAEERKADCEHNETDEKVQLIKMSSESVSCANHPTQYPPTSTSIAANCSVSHHIYENISKYTPHSKCSPANLQEDHDISSRIYIKPLPAVLSERTGDGSFGKCTDKPAVSKNVTSKPTGNCTSNESTRSHSDSKERSLWFGLDITGID